MVTPEEALSKGRERRRKGRGNPTSKAIVKLDDGGEGRKLKKHSTAHLVCCGWEGHKTPHRRKEGEKGEVTCAGLDYT